VEIGETVKVVKTSWEGCSGVVLELKIIEQKKMAPRPGRVIPPNKSMVLLRIEKGTLRRRYWFKLDAVRELTDVEKLAAVAVEMPIP
jgi:hypothetical protein